MGRKYLLGSAVAHLLLLAVVFFVPTGRVRAQPQTIQVALVNLPPGAVRSAAETAMPSAPEPEPAEASGPEHEAEPAEKNAVKLPKPDEPKPKPKTRPSGAPSDRPSVSGSLGVPGLEGEVSVDAADFAFTYYLIAIRNRISQNWGAPAGLMTGGKPIKAMVYFKVDRGGRIGTVRLEGASGVPFFDQSALRAVTVSSPLPPLPAGYGESTLGVYFGFTYSDR